MHYFCYISEHKVEQTISQIEAESIDKITETKEITKKINGELSSNLINIVKTTAGYGKDERILLSQDKRRTIVSKLKDAINYIVNNNEIIDTISNNTIKFDSISRVCFIRTSLKVSSYDSTYAYLESTKLTHVNLKLSCSIKYFSDMYGQNTNNPVHSGNIDFFNGNISPEFEGIIFIIGKENDLILASPLYLSLPLKSQVDL